MDRVFDPTEASYSSIPFVAVAITKSGEQQHVGLLHRRADTAEVFLLDLAWHCRLRNAPPNRTYLWIAPNIPARRARLVAGKCRQIWNGNGRETIPYGFGEPFVAFDHSTARYIGGPEGRGLTCASFVLAVFQFAGVQLVDYATWPTGRPDDIVWRGQIIQAMRENGVVQERIDVLQNDPSDIRYRPSEVAAAATFPPPASFDRIRDIVSHIEDRLRSSPA